MTQASSNPVIHIVKKEEEKSEGLLVGCLQKKEEKNATKFLPLFQGLIPEVELIESLERTVNVKAADSCKRLRVPSGAVRELEAKSKTSYE